MYECCICHKHARRTLAGIMRHIREVHPHFEGKVKCGVDGCPTTASSYESLRQHMYRKHKAILQHNGPLCEPQRSVSFDLENDDGDESLGGATLDPSFAEYPTNGQHSRSSLVAAKFILKSRDGRKLTQTTMDGILQDTRNIVECTVDVLEASVLKKLQAFDRLTSEQVAEIRSLFTTPSLRNPFEGLETHYQQEKFFQEQFSYVVSVKLIMDVILLATFAV